MAKSLRDITGTNASKVVKLDHKDMYQWNSPDGVKFVDDKHPVNKHEDRVGNSDEVYKGKTKKAAYKSQSDSVYEEVEQIDEISKDKVVKYVKASIAKDKAEKEEGKKSQSFPDAVDGTKKPSKHSKKRSEGRSLALDKLSGDAKVPATEETDANITNQKLGAGEKKTAIKECDCDKGCNSSPKGMKCEVHGEDECPGYKDKKGRKLLTDKKKAWEAIEIGKALRVGNQFSDMHLAREKRNPNNLGKPADLLNKANKTIGKLKGSTFMVKKLTEEQLHELSMKVLSSYIKKATNEMSKIAKKDPQNRTFKDTDKYYDRAKGVDKAKEKLD